MTRKSRPGILWCNVRWSDGALLQEGLVDDSICDYTHPRGRARHSVRRLELIKQRRARSDAPHRRN